MSKTRNTGFLTNVVQYNTQGDITFVSGSTTLLTISSSGEVITTGVISGSNALSSSYSVSSSQAENATLLDNLDSTSFVYTSSFNSYSSSVSGRVSNLESTASVLTSASASFAVVSSSYASASGSLSTRVTTLENTSASFATMSGSIASRVTKIEGNYATTGSNAFNGSQNITGSLTVSQAVIAQTLNVQQVTSSIVYSCGSNIFGCAIGDVQQMTGSVRITGSLNTIGNACLTSVCSPAFVGGTMSGTTVYGSTVVCSAVVCSPQSVFSYTGTTGNAVRINGDNLTTGTALSIVANNGSPSHTGNVVEICNAFNAGAAAKLLCLYQGDDGDGIYVNMARGGVGLTIDGVGSGYSAIFNNGNVGIGTASPCSLLDVTVGGAGTRRLFVNYDDSLITIKGASNSTSPENLRLVGDNIIFNTGIAGSGTERMRFTGTGIACFSSTVCAPNIWLNSCTSLIVYGSNDAVNPYLQGDSSNNLYLGTNNNYKILIPNDSGTMIFRTATSQPRLCITSTGIAVFACQVCLPTSNTSLVAGTYGTISNVGGIDTNIGNNAYYDGTNWRRFAAQEAARIYINRDSFSFLRKASDGAGSTISWDNTLFLASSGIACFACQVCAPTLIVQRNLGTLYNQTSTTGTTSIVDTGIFYNTAVVGFGGAAIYQLTLTGNANAAGSGAYQNMIIGYVTIVTGFDFGISSVVNQIAYSDILNRSASNVGGLTITACFWNGSAESSQQVAGTTTNQIRIKVTGYNSSFVGSNQELRLTKLI